MTELLFGLFKRVFLFVMIGAALGRFKGPRAERAANAVVPVLLNGVIPVYMFLAMWVTPIPAVDTLSVALVALLVMACGGLFVWIWARAVNISVRGHALPVMFMNSAYLAIPVNTLLWGAQGAAYTIVYNFVLTVTQFTVGIWVAKRENAFAEMASLPLLYAMALGLVLNLAGMLVPWWASSSSRLIGVVTLPCMLMLVGYRIGALNAAVLNHAAWGVALRMGGGFLTAVVVAAAAGLTGPLAGVCIMTSAMPAAVYSFILTERYGGNAAFAAAAVLLGTLLSLVTIPVLAYFYAGIR